MPEDAFHQRMRKVKGKASLQRCVDCGSQARDWSYVHDTAADNMDNYVPRCRRCHIEYDETPPKRIESMRKNGTESWLADRKRDYHGRFIK